AELRQGAAAQAEQQNALGRAIKEQESHHLAGITKAQPVRIVETHGTLHGLEVKMQQPSRPAVDDVGLVIGPIGKALTKGLVATARRLQEAQHAVCLRKRASDRQQACLSASHCASLKKARNPILCSPWSAELRDSDRARN